MKAMKHAASSEKRSKLIFAGEGFAEPAAAMIRAPTANEATPPSRIDSPILDLASATASFTGPTATVA